jgi:hypothetical protein
LGDQGRNVAEVVIVRSGAGLQTHIRIVRDLPVGERHVL